HGTGNASKLLDMIKSGEKNYEFIEIMGCPGGCVTGGGTPILHANVYAYCDPRKERAKALYVEDAGKHKRKSHENEEVKKLYEDYLGEIGGHKAHHLLHTHYQKRSKY
ncbi:MAG TPA: ferredoxin, partial [Clostridiales bacterium]|nr:ferredoxin [Clostridiales bacterium]